MRITLATLASATAQQVFDQVRDHMLRQGKQSKLRPTGPICAYRSHDGLMCAAGCLIGDDEYISDMEEKAWWQLSFRGIVPDAHPNLIRSLQGIHDRFKPEFWERELRDLAQEHDLAWTITLASLPTASAQEVFEHVAKHLLKQNERCQVDTNCAYRGKAGACAAGSLMSDAEAEGLTKFNVGYGWLSLLDRRLVPRAHAELVVGLQRIHDSWWPHEWRAGLQRLAASNGLDAAFLAAL
ncbi:hypothetical protein [Luteibacter sp. ME-Dv--P-043b]|uniref:hypothetical protein n=1 Tax=Luteibacter sp. ME-Dv--P-043b TaxID=3040291 RepID=UPI0025521494|nr:hypothetical protein [Luteibacter sp. ME-Dv--P-043b]